jgi:hypothetical protein
MKTIPHGQNHIIQHNLVLIHTAHHIHHNVAFGLVKHDAVVVEDDIGGLFLGFLEETFFEDLLRLDIGVRGWRCCAEVSIEKGSSMWREDEHEDEWCGGV